MPPTEEFDRTYSSTFQNHGLAILLHNGLLDISKISSLLSSFQYTAYHVVKQKMVFETWVKTGICIFND